MRKAAAALAGVVLLGVVSGCTPAPTLRPDAPAKSFSSTRSVPSTPSAAAPSSPTSAAPAPGGGSGGTDWDTSGASRLLPLPPERAGAARALIGALPTRGRGPTTGYSRALFGQAWTDDAGSVLWAGNHCNQRQDVLSRDLDAVVRRGACVVTAGTFTDPYTAAPQVFTKASSDRWPIDHVVPEALAYAMGASTWPADKRVEFANDPLNLVATTNTANTAKGDSGPASWLPPNKAIRCAYVTRFALVATKYALPVTAADKNVMAAQCR